GQAHRPNGGPDGSSVSRLSAKIRNPNIACPERGRREIRRKSEIPKWEFGGPSDFVFRASNFLRISVFEFRISSLPSPCDPINTSTRNCCRNASPGADGLHQGRSMCQLKRWTDNRNRRFWGLTAVKRADKNYSCHRSAASGFWLERFS